MENANPKHNPLTTWPGVGLLLLSLAMVICKYFLPLFMTLKRDIAYEWYVPFVVGGAGLLLVYMTDDYFAQMFSVGKNYVSKKTTTTTTESKTTESKPE